MRFDTETAKKGFMVIDKDPHHKRKNFYNIFMFMLEEDDFEKGILRYRKKPIFQGMVELESINTASGHSKIEAFRFWKRIHPPNTKNLKYDLDNNLLSLKPRLFKKMFKNSKFIVIPITQEEEEHAEPVYDMAKRFQIEEKIRRYNLCSHCKRKRRFTLLSGNDYFIGYNKQKICKDCAGKEVFHMLNHDYELEVSSHMKYIMKRQLLKFRSIPKIMKMFRANFNPLNHEELTLYDKKERSKNLVNRLKKIKNIPIRELDIPDQLRKYYLRNGIKELLPIQTMAVKQGLFRNENLLVISSTSSGKTLLGELSGFSKMLREKMQKNPMPEDIKGLSAKQKRAAQRAYNRTLSNVPPDGKMLYLVPIVALASLRYQEYKELKEIGIQAALKVGTSFMDSDYRNEFGLVSRSDIIIGTYEAIDVMLRVGNKNGLGNVETIIIDEIQMLNDEERGWVIDGLVARLRFLYPKAQFIFLSATISKPADLARHYNSRLIEFKGRPVPMDRHLIMMLNEFEKKKSLLLLCEDEFKKRSSYGLKGQTLVFTNSRKKCHKIAEFLSNHGVRSDAYHGGLTIRERRIIEDKYNKQKLSAVVTTAALAAGVDFPASQVIFESLAMGIQWLTVAEFEQMSGRAGRYKKHDKAKVVILCEPGKSYHSGQRDSEEKVAVQLLNGQIEPIELDPDENRMYTEVLAFISMMSPKGSYHGPVRREILKFHGHMFNNNFSLDHCLKFLKEKRFVNRGGMRPNGAIEISTTNFGKAGAESFYPVRLCLKIKESLEMDFNLIDISEEMPPTEEESQEWQGDASKDEEKTENSMVDSLPVEMALELQPMHNIYLSNALVKEISPKRKGHKYSSLLFNNSTLSLLTADNLGRKRRLSKFIRDVLLTWNREIFNCDCEDRPYCNCGRKNIEKMLLTLVLEGLPLRAILKSLRKQWQIKVYMGDLIDYIDSISHNLRSIYKIGKDLDVNAEVAWEIKQIPKILKFLR